MLQFTETDEHINTFMYLDVRLQVTMFITRFLTAYEVSINGKTPDSTLYYDLLVSNNTSNNILNLKYTKYRA